MKTVIPSYSLYTDRVTDPHEQMAYLLSFAFMNPGSTSSQIEDMLVSIRKLLAECGHDKARFVTALESQLHSAVERYNPRYRTIVKADDISDIAYRITVSIYDEYDQLVVNRNMLRVSDGNLCIDYGPDTLYKER